MPLIPQVRHEARNEPWYWWDYTDATTAVSIKCRGPKGGMRIEISKRFCDAPADVDQTQWKRPVDMELLAQVYSRLQGTLFVPMSLDEAKEYDRKLAAQRRIEEEARARERRREKALKHREEERKRRETLAAQHRCEAEDETLRLQNEELIRSQREISSLETRLCRYEQENAALVEQMRDISSQLASPNPMIEWVSHSHLQEQANLLNQRISGLGAKMSELRITIFNFKKERSMSYD